MTKTYRGYTLYWIPYTLYYRRAAAGAVCKQPMTVATSGECYADTLPLNLIQRATASASSSSPSCHPGLRPSYTVPAMAPVQFPPYHHATSLQLPSYQRPCTSLVTSLVTSSSAGVSSATTSKPRCFECPLCGKRFKVSTQSACIMF